MVRYIRAARQLMVTVSRRFAHLTFCSCRFVPRLDVLPNKVENDGENRRTAGEDVIFAVVLSISLSLSLSHRCSSIFAVHSFFPCRLLRPSFFAVVCDFQLAKRFGDAKWKRRNVGNLVETV